MFNKARIGYKPMFKKKTIKFSSFSKHPASTPRPFKPAFITCIKIILLETVELDYLMSKWPCKVNTKR